MSVIVNNAFVSMNKLLDQILELIVKNYDESDIEFFDYSEIFNAYNNNYLSRETIHRKHLEIVFDKLENDGFIKKIGNSFTITLESIYFIQQGGYTNRAEKQERASRNYCSMQKLLAYVYFAAAVAGIIFFGFEIVKFFYK